MKNQQEEITEIRVMYLDKWGQDAPRPNADTKKVRLSVYITPEESHHIDIPVNESRYRLAGLLIRLAESVAKGV